MKPTLRDFIKANHRPLLLVFALYGLVTLAIASAHYPYIDDALRQLNGSTGFIASYGRYVSEYAAVALQGSWHLTDMGWTTHLLSGLIMGLCSTLLLYFIYEDKPVTWMGALASTLLGINPWFMELFSFRFDTPYMTLSVLVAILPFLWAEKHLLLFIPSSIIGLLLMFNAYQATSGIYFVLLLTIALRRFIYLTENKLRGILSIFGMLFAGLFAYLAATGLYLFEMSLLPQLQNRGDATKMASLDSLPQVAYDNFLAYLNSIIDRSTQVWLVTALIIIVLFIISILIASKINKLATLCLSLLFLSLGAIASSGVYLFLEKPLIAGMLRYGPGLPFFFGVIATWTCLSMKQPYLYWLKTLPVLIFSYYMVSFSLTYAGTLYYQQKSFEQQAAVLTYDLNQILLNEYAKDDRGRIRVYANKVLNDSPIFINTAKNYPVLKRLIPSNTTIYWPNSVRLQTATRHNIFFYYLDFAPLNMEQMTILTDNTSYTIFTDGDSLFFNNKIQ